MSMNWNSDCLYKHDDNTDVAFQVISEESDGQLLVYWYNVGSCHKPWPMNVMQNIVIKSEEKHKWHKMPLR